MTWVMSCMAAPRLGGSLMEPMHTSSCGRCALMKRWLLAGRSSTAVGMPCARRLSKMWLPTNPLAPVRRTFIDLPRKNSSRWAGTRFRGTGQPRSHNTKLPAGFAEFVQREIDLAVRMRSHEADANQLAARRHRRRHHRVDEHAFLLQPLAELERDYQIPTVNRKNRCLGSAKVEPQGNQPLFHAPGVSPELPGALSFRDHDLNC